MSSDTIPCDLNNNTSIPSLHQSPAGPFRIERGPETSRPDFMAHAEWTLGEKCRYAAFIEAHRQKMEGKEHRILWKLYELMGVFIGTRNLRQCKSYHQKMIDRHHSFSKILALIYSEHPEAEEQVAQERKALEGLKKAGDKEMRQSNVKTADKPEEDPNWGAAQETKLEEWSRRLQKLVFTHVVV